MGKALVILAKVSCAGAVNMASIQMNGHNHDHHSPLGFRQFGMGSLALGLSWAAQV